MAEHDAHRAIAAIWHIEAASVIGAVARIVRDVGLAEEFAQDALVAALEHWPQAGIPDKPGAWLTTAAKRRALDHLRHEQIAAGKAEDVARELDFQHAVASDEADAAREAKLDDALRGGVGDDVLRLIFTACHPVLPPEARCALTLRVMGGLSTDEIARAYLKPEATIAQRIVRAKRSLAAARVPFEVPRGEALAGRLASVLEVIYLIFNEGYAATSGSDWMRPALSEEALRLGRVLAGLMPDEPEVFGLVALMEIQASRFAARLSASGEPILLQDQDRSRWDALLIRRGLLALAHAEALQPNAGPYTLQAAIAACHARAARVEDTDWARIVSLYDTLAQRNPSPVVALNRAVAFSMAYGPADALPLVDALQADPALQAYHLLPAVRGDLLERLGRLAEAAAAFEHAASLARNQRERRLLQARAARCRG
ncbi:RNA polymerase sigma factor [Niveibacterium microcysteis]|uniref:RNA polymerase sigma factor n=1 Tax=Niveibacterium microcysteis TaxID=2811415 RepID=A0ABX7M3U7_9RHOO|nr:RNA polymerase sigma factor [Niveibacterium microcysteis]QSI76433.1 RNA polymerase sigma factor [Niveibacterium microcysteis]